MDSSTAVNNNFGPQKAPRKWSPEEDQALEKAVKQYSARNWKEIALFVPGRDQHQCRARWNKALRPGLRRGRWSVEEDKVLTEIAEKLKFDWREISSNIPGRNPKQCKERWSHNLDPSINRNKWTKLEDDKLLSLYKEHGSRWSRISSEIDGRTENQVKSRYRTLVRSRVASHSKGKSWTSTGSPNTEESNETVTNTEPTHAHPNNPQPRQAGSATSRSTSTEQGEAFMQSTSTIARRAPSSTRLERDDALPMSPQVVDPAQEAEVAVQLADMKKWQSPMPKWSRSQPSAPAVQVPGMYPYPPYQATPMGWSGGFGTSFPHYQSHHMAQFRGSFTNEGHSVSSPSQQSNPQIQVTPTKREKSGDTTTAATTRGKRSSPVATEQDRKRFKYQDSQTVQPAGIEVPSSDYRGISLELVKTFWKGVLEHHDHPEVLLLITTKESWMAVKSGNNNTDPGVKQLIPESTTIKLDSKPSLNRWTGLVKDIGMVSFRPSSVRKKRRDEWTCNDILDYIIKPDVEEGQCSFLDTYMKNNPEMADDWIGEPFKGTYVSFAHQTKMSHLLEALQGYREKARARDPSYSQYVWIDIFAWQHIAPPEKYDEHRKRVKESVHEAICRFDDCVVMLASWENPLALKRMWSIWEMYGAAKIGKGFQVCLTETVAAQFADALVHNYDALVQAILKVDISKYDKLAYWRFSTDDVYKINGSVREQLREWFASTASDFCKDAMTNREYLEEPEFVFRLLSRTARLLKDQSKFQLAEAMYNSALRVATTLRQVHPKHRAYHTTLTSLAGVYMEQGQFQKAESSYEKAMEVILSETPLTERQGLLPVKSICLASLGGDLSPKASDETLTEDGWKRGLDEDKARIYHNMARLSQVRGKYHEADILFKGALEIREKLFGTNHPDYASTLHWYGDLMLVQDKRAEADELLTKAREISTEVYQNRDHPKYAAVLRSIAELRYKELRYGDSEKLYLEVQRVLEQILGQRHGEYGEILARLAQVYRKQNKFEMANPLLLRAYDIMENLFGRDHVKCAERLYDLGRLKYHQQSYVDAESYYEQAREVYVNIKATSEAGYTKTTVRLADVKCKLGSSAQAIPLYDEALFALKVDSKEYAEVMESLAIAHQKIGNLDNAEDFYRKLKETHSKLYGETNEKYGEICRKLGELLRERDVEGAEELIKIASDISKSCTDKELARALAS